MNALPKTEIYCANSTPAMTSDLQISLTKSRRANPQPCLAPCFWYPVLSKSVSLHGMGATYCPAHLKCIKISRHICRWRSKDGSIQLTLVWKSPTVIRLHSSSRFPVFVGSKLLMSMSTGPMSFEGVLIGWLDPLWCLNHLSLKNILKSFLQDGDIR